MAREIVIIGGVATGPKAAARARRRDAEARITIIEKGKLISYAGCGMPYFMGGLIEDVGELTRTAAGIDRNVGYFKSYKDVDVLTGTLAKSIDRQRKEVVLADMDSGQTSTIHYDKLVLATGAVPIMPPIEGLDLGRVFRLAHPDDAVAIRRTAFSRGIRRVAVVGGGLIGMEAAECLAEAGFDVTIVEMLPHVLAALLDPEISALLENYLRSNGVDLRTGERVLKLQGDESGNVHKVITDRSEVQADMVVVAIGVRPNVSLAQEAGLELGPTGAIAVNQYMQTSDPDIYAGGDCVENTHLVSGKKVYVPLGSTANKHGRVIGDNITGGQSTFEGVAGTTVLKVLNYKVGRTGLTEQEALRLGYKVRTSIAPSSDSAHYYPENKKITVKLIADASTDRVLGAQVLGEGEAVKRVDVVATALTFGATVDQLARLDLGYAPPFNTAIDAVHVAANVVGNKRDGLAVALSPAEVHDKLVRGDDFIFLDVRQQHEYEERERIEDPRVKLIPLGELRRRLGELPRDAEIVTFCAFSLRGYEAQRILAGAGFKNVKFVDGGLSSWPYEKVVGKKE